MARQDGRANVYQSKSAVSGVNREEMGIGVSKLCDRW